MKGHIWREYSRADERWCIYDPLILSVELATVFVGILCILNVYAIYTKASFRYSLQIIICVSELYGGWMTFAPEWFAGSPNLHGSSFTLLWIYLVFMNGLWVVLPLVFLWDSISRVNYACDAVKFHKIEVRGGPSLSLYYGVIGLLFLYMILVPTVLFSAKWTPLVQ